MSVKEREHTPMTDDFTIVKNKLTATMPMLRLKNAHYSIKIFYGGDYETDREKGCIDRLKIKCVVKALSPKNAVIIDPINNAANITLLTDIVKFDEIDSVIEQLGISKISLEKIKPMIKEYFGIET